MDLKTTYMGLELRNPLVAAASPLTKNIDNYKKLEDGGVAAIVNHSLFEEQITHEQMEQDHYASQGTESFAEALSAKQMEIASPLLGIPRYTFIMITAYGFLLLFFASLILFIYDLKSIKKSHMTD